MSNKKSPQTNGSFKNLKPKKDYINLQSQRLHKDISYHTQSNNHLGDKRARKQLRENDGSLHRGSIQQNIWNSKPNLRTHEDDSD